MRTTMCLGEIGKRINIVQKPAEICTMSQGRRLRVMDYNSGFNFLVDTGADISVIPALKKDRVVCSDYRLFAANGTQIPTYGVKSMIVDLKLRRPYRWNFVIADVNQPILGADFLSAHKLLVDISRRKLIDQVTELGVSAVMVSSNQPSIYTVDENHPYHTLLSNFPNITKPATYKEVPQHNVVHHIETTGPPVYARARPLPPDRLKKVMQEFKYMQEQGICRPSKSAWASPLHVVMKKNGDIRPCGDYRMLNAVTKPDRYPIPRLHDFTYNLAEKNIFSNLDINRAYHCISVAEEDVEKTAIITPFGLFEFTKMGFGMRNSAQSFQRFMNNTVLEGLDFLFCYLDDILIASDTESQHKEHLRLVFERFEKFGITINLTKCTLGQSKLEFLGHEVSKEGIRPLDDKVKAILDYPKPQTVEQLRRFLGMINFYRPHIPNAASIQAELDKYLGNTKKRDKTPIVWTVKAEESFALCKASLQKATTLAHPRADTALALMTDASDTSAGSVLQQRVDNAWQPLGFYSKKFTKTQQQYSTYDRELLAIYLGIIHFRKMFEGRPLTIYTDHRPLCFAFQKLGKNDKELPRRTRQLLFISEFTTDIRHVTGQDNVVADTLSRIATISCPTVLDYERLANEQANDDYILHATQSIRDREAGSKIVFKSILIPTCNKPIFCEMSTPEARPYLPESFRRQAFDSVHNLSHPGIRSSKKLVKQRFFWPNLEKDVGAWAKTCIHCQRSKINRHTVSRIGSFEDAERFQHIHVDLVGPLPTSQQGYRYLVTIIDRGSRWPEAFPIADITAELVAKTIFEGWIVRYGCPLRLTTDQGRQFESNLFKELLKLLGVDKLRTTAYNPKANGRIERFHRSLKAALMARMQNNSSWIDELPLVMLGLRAAGRSDNGVSPAETTFGQALRLPGDFFNSPSKPEPGETSDFVRNIRETINKLKPVSTSSRNNQTLFIHPDLHSCEYVFLRNDTVRKSLQPPYDGPFKVIERGPKVFLVQLGSKQVRVSIDRLKPAYVLNTTDDGTKTSVKPTDNATQAKATARPDTVVTVPTVPQQYVTKRGRIVKKTVTFKDTYYN